MNCVVSGKWFAPTHGGLPLRGANHSPHTTQFIPVPLTTQLSF